MKKSTFHLLFTCLFLLFVQNVKAEFQLIPLGVYGGVDTHNMTSFLLKDSAQTHYLALDAGTIAPGINIAIQKGAISIDNSISNKTAYVYRDQIDSYWISHAHLDHVAGLIALSPEDSNKNIYGIKPTLATLKNNYFDWKAWPNMTNEGDVPLNQYRLHKVNTLTPFVIGRTGLTGTALELDHGINPITKNAYPSSALLITNHNNESIVFFGDTGPDKEQQSTKLDNAWKIVSNHIKNHQIKAIIIECSYTNTRKTSELYGHLNPVTLLRELKKLEHYGGGKGSLKNIKVFIIHAKPSADKTGSENHNIIINELNQENTMGIDFILPEQGQLYKL